MPQCKAVHPNSPSPRIFICIEERGHKDYHYTYSYGGKWYKWAVTPSENCGTIET